MLFNYYVELNIIFRLPPDTSVAPLRADAIKGNEQQIKIFFLGEDSIEALCLLRQDRSDNQRHQNAANSDRNTAEDQSLSKCRSGRILRVILYFYRVTYFNRVYNKADH